MVIGLVANMMVRGGNLRYIYSQFVYALLAQLVEQDICNIQVVGSSPTRSSKLYRGLEQRSARRAHIVEKTT